MWLSRKKTASFKSVARTHVGCRRKINEDAVLSRPDLGLWAMADGMGGHEAGDVASSLLVSMLSAENGKQRLSSRVAAARKTLIEANRKLRAMGAAAVPPHTIGSTIVVMAADAASFACLWAGDSRAYLARGGCLTQLTRDHSLVQQLVDAGDLDVSAAATHPNANIITRAVGADAELEIDSFEGDIMAGDGFLLASDGLTRLMSDREMLEALSAEDLDAAADLMMKTCLDRGAPDNVSFILLKAR
jgi:serine/threonine protein phosphatase PrpC